MLRSVIFDMDGVIIDSEPIHLKISSDICKSLNVILKESDLDKIIGKSAKNIWEMIIDEFDLNLSSKELMMKQLEDNMKYFSENKIEPIDGVLRLLKTLKNNKIKIALASSSHIKFINLILDKLDIKKYFDIVVSGENLKQSKPHPEIFLCACDKLKSSPKECIVIEDSAAGVKAAKNAGIKCIGFKNIHSGNQDLTKADLIVNKFDELNLNDFKNLCIN